MIEKRQNQRAPAVQRLALRVDRVGRWIGVIFLFVIFERQSDIADIVQTLGATGGWPLAPIDRPPASGSGWACLPAP